MNRDWIETTSFFVESLEVCSYFRWFWYLKKHWIYLYLISIWRIKLKESYQQLNEYESTIFNYFFCIFFASVLHDGSTVHWIVVEFLNTQLEPTNTVSAYGLVLTPLLYGANYLQIFPVISLRPQFNVRIFPMLQYRDAHRNLSIFMNLKSTSVLCENGEKWEHLGL